MSSQNTAMNRISYSELQCETIVIAPYESSWAREYEQELNAIENVVKADRYTIAHVGSTSVPGLVAKPTIDIAIGTKSPDDYTPLVDGLASLGYLHYPEYRDWLPDIGLFIKRDHIGRRSHHALVVTAESQVWYDYLDFREYLIRQPDVAKAYGLLKRSAAARYPHDRFLYNTQKTAFITACLREYRTGVTTLYI